MQEEILRDLYNSDNSWNIVILRYFNPISQLNESMKEDPNGIPNNLFPYIVKVYNKQLPLLQIYGNDYDTIDGTCERDFIHVVDLAKAHVATRKYMNESDSRENFDIFNIGTGKGTSVLEIVETFKKINNVKLPYIFKERRFGDIESVFCNCDKAFQKMGWSANLNIEDICRDAYKFAQYQTT